MSIFVVGFAGAEVNQKSLRYHEILRGKPANDVLRERFFNAWIDSESTGELQKFLETRTTGGTEADWQILAAFHEQLGQATDARPILDEGLKNFPAAPGLRLARAKLAMRLLDFETASDDLERLAKDGKADLEILKLQGTLLIRRDRGAEALEIWKKALESEPENDDLREDLIEINLAEGLEEEALKLARELVVRAEDPYKKAVRQLRAAEISIEIGQSEAGLKNYREVIAASGDGTWLEREAVSKVELIFDRDDDAQGLLDFLNSLREDHPQRTSLRKAVARQKAKVGEVAEAVAMLREVIRVTPGNLANREELIALLEQEKQWAEAALELESLVGMREDDASLWQRLVAVRRELEEPELLKKALAKFQQLNSDNVTGIIKSAELYAGSDFSKEATEILRAGYQKFPESGELAKALATRLVMEEKGGEAVPILLAISKSGKREDLLSAASSLTGHGFAEEGFQLLLDAKDFENDPLVLTQLCQLARSPEQANSAVPAALNLVRQATSPVGLQNSLRLAVSTILRAEKVPDLIKTLSAFDKLEAGDRCLLAELHAEMADFQKARELLRNAPEDSGDLVKFHAVHFEQNHGVLGEAISLLSKLVANPANRKAVHLRRLAMMHRQAGNLNSALTVIDDWRQTVPGDQRAWRERIGLLEDMGRQDEAIVEMRRMISKFGATVDHRARLAAALHQTRDLAGAVQLYQKLYETADQQNAKLKWAKSWAKVAKERGTLEELKTGWKRRATRNPREVTPLLALAEVQLLERDFAGVRDSLSEAVRRRPGDVKLLTQSAAQLQEQGQLIPAIDLLKEATKHDKSDMAMQALVDLYFQANQSEEAISLLIKNAQNDDPRGVEKTAQKLWTNEWQREARRYLEGKIEKFPGDWRLRYLMVRMLIETGDKEKALPLLRQLENATGELPGVAKQAPAGNSKQVVPIPTEFEAWQQASSLIGLVQGFPITPAQPFHFSNYISQHNIYNISLLHSHQGFPGPAWIFQGHSQTYPNPLRLPQSAEQARRMALLDALTISSTREQAVDDALARAVGTGRNFILAMYRKEEFQKLMAERFGTGKARLDDALAVMTWLPSETGDQRKLILTAFETLAKKRPQKTLAHLSKAIQVVPVKERVKWFRHIYAAIPERDRDQALTTIYYSDHTAGSPFIVSGWAGYSSGYYNTHRPPPPEITATSEFVIQAILKRPPNSQNAQLAQTLLTSTLSYQRGEQAVELLNFLVKILLSKTQVPGNPTSIYTTSQFGLISSIDPPQLPSLQLLPFPIYSYFATGRSEKLTTAQKSRRDQLLAELATEDEKAATTTDFASVLKPHLAKIENPVIRGYALHQAGQKEELKKLALEMAETADLNQLRFAAGVFYKEGKALASVTALMKAYALAPDARLQVELGGQAAAVAMTMSPADREKIDLELIVSAVRARARTSQDSWTLEALRKLGFQEEADRMAQLAKQRTTNQSRMRQQRKTQSRNSTTRATIAQSIKNGDKAKALELGVQKYRRLGVRIGIGTNSNRNNLLFENLKQLGEAGLMEDFLKATRPEENAPLGERLSFGGLIIELRKTDYESIPSEEAAVHFKNILAEDPDHWEAFIGLIVMKPGEFEDWDRLYQLRRAQGGNNLYQNLANLVIGQQPPSLEGYEFAVRLIERYMRGDHLPKDSEKVKTTHPGNFYWVRNLVDHFGSIQIFAEGRGQVAPGNDPDFHKIDGDVKARHLELLRRCYDLLLDSPQLSDIAFQGYQKFQTDFKLSDEELDQLANRVLSESPVIEHWDTPNYGIFVRNQALDWLMRRESKVGKQLLSDDLRKHWQANSPVSLETFEVVREIAMANPAESAVLYKKWHLSLPGMPGPDEDQSDAKVIEKKNLRFRKIIQFTQFFVTRTPAIPSWAPDHGKLVFNQAILNHEARQLWINYLTKVGGRRDFALIFDSLATQYLGPPETWATLVELNAMQSLPQAKAQSVALLTQQLSNLQTSNPSLAFREKIAVAIFERDLQMLLIGLVDQYQKTLGQHLQWPKVQSNRLLSLYQIDPENPITAAQVLLFAEAIQGRTRLNEKTIEHFQKALAGKKNFHPLIELLLQSAIHGENPDPIAGAAEAMSGQLELLEEALEKWPSKTLAMVEKMVPKSQVKDAGPEVRDFLKRCRLEEQNSLIEELRKYAKDGPPISGGFNTAWQLLAKVAKDDPEEAARNGVLLLDQLRSLKPDPTVSRSPAIGSIHSLLRGLLNHNHQIGIVNWTIIIDHLYRSRHRDFLPTFRENPFTELPVPNANLNLPKKVGVPKNLEPILERLTREQQQTLACFSYHYLIDFSRTGDSLENKLTSLKGEFRENHPWMADLLTFFLIAQQSAKLITGDLRKQGAECLNRALEDTDFPDGLRLHLASTFSYTHGSPNDANSLITEAGKWPWVLESVRQYRDSPARVPGFYQHNIIFLPNHAASQLLKVDPTAAVLIVDHLLESFRSSSPIKTPKILSSLLEAGHIDQVVRAIEAAPQKFEDDLILLWSLWENGERGLVEKLLQRKPSQYQLNNHLFFPFKWSPAFDQFLQKLPDDQAYLASFELSQSTKSGNVPGEERLARQRDLARRFANEAPADLTVRKRILAAFSEDSVSRAAVMKEMEKVCRNHSLTTLTRSSQADPNLAKIYQVMLVQKVAQKDYEAFEKEISEFVTEPIFSKQAKDGQAHLRAQDLITSVLLLAAESPQIARDLLPLCDRLLKATWTNDKPDGDPIAASVWSMALMLHLLVGEEETWSAHEHIGFDLDEERENWSPVPNRAFASFGKRFFSEECREFRPRIGKLFLASKWVQARLLKMAFTEGIPPYVNIFVWKMNPDELQTYITEAAVDSPCSHRYRYYFGRKLLEERLKAAGDDPKEQKKAYQEAATKFKSALDISTSRNDQNFSDEIKADLKKARKKSREPDSSDSVENEDAHHR